MCSRMVTAVLACRCTLLSANGRRTPAKSTSAPTVYCIPPAPRPARSTCTVAQHFDLHRSRSFPFVGLALGESWDLLGDSWRFRHLLLRFMRRPSVEGAPPLQRLSSACLDLLSVVNALADHTPRRVVGG
jgi:hypothetical protein